jgi:hypothetical protein
VDTVRIDIVPDAEINNGSSLILKGTGIRNLSIRQNTGQKKDITVESVRLFYDPYGSTEIEPMEPDARSFTDNSDLSYGFGITDSFELQKGFDHLFGFRIEKAG